MPDEPKLQKRDPSPAPRRGRSSTRPTFSAVLEDGRLIEAVYRRAEQRTLFCVCQGKKWTEEPAVTADGERLVPYAATNNLLRHGVVLLPSGPEEYESQTTLLAEIREHIHRYVDLSSAFEALAAHYVLLSWIYDGFNELPYLRVRGEPGSGKTRFLHVVGSLCYKPIFASGASTVSPIFRMLDSVQGTLVMDESDFRFSDERAEMTKILNNGNARGFPVLRSELVGRHEFDPRAYYVFGPKLVATRGFFEDPALESRFLTEDMGRSPFRSEVPISLPPEASAHALALRNKLLLFRFRNHGRRTLTSGGVDAALEPRLNQIFGPLLSVIDEPAARRDLCELVRQVNRQHVADRGLETEAQVLEVIRDLLREPEARLSINAITQCFTERFGENYERRVTPKWVGGLIRRKLLLRTQKSGGVFVVPVSEHPTLRRLFERYGLTSANEDAQPAAKRRAETPYGSGHVPDVPDLHSDDARHA